MGFFTWRSRKVEIEFVMHLIMKNLTALAVTKKEALASGSDS
jgi:hypothetical protein